MAWFSRLVAATAAVAAAMMMAAVAAAMMMVMAVVAPVPALAQGGLDPMKPVIPKADLSVEPRTGTGPSVLDIAAGNPNLSTLVQAIKAAGLDGLLQSSNPVTVFAPTNDAFARMAPGTLENLMRPENRDDLIELVREHIVFREVESEDMRGRIASLGTGNLDRIRVNPFGRGIHVAGRATVIQPDIEASNGIVHVIDRVIVPSPDIR